MVAAFGSVCRNLRARPLGNQGLESRNLLCARKDTSVAIGQLGRCVPGRTFPHAWLAGVTSPLGYDLASPIII